MSSLTVEGSGIWHSYQSTNTLNRLLFWYLYFYFQVTQQQSFLLMFTLNTFQALISKLYYIILYYRSLVGRFTSTWVKSSNQCFFLYAGIFTSTWVCRKSCLYLCPLCTQSTIPVKTCLSEHEDMPASLFVMFFSFSLLRSDVLH